MRRARIVLLVLFMSVAGLSGETGMEELERRLETSAGAERVEILNELAVLTRVNQPRESIRYAAEALQLADSLPDSRTKADVIKNLGIGYYYLADYNLALGHYRSSLSLSEKLDYQTGIADALNNIGIIHYVWGEYDRSLDFYFRAMQIRRQLGDREGLAKCLNNLGTVYYATERYPQSLQFYSNALEIYEELGNERLVASSLNNIGLLSYKLEQYEDALEQLQRALEIEKRIGNLPLTANSLNTIGMVHETWKEDYETALDYYERSLAVRESIGDRQGVASCEVSIGTAYTKMGDPSRALDSLERALRAAQEMNIKEIERDAHLGISKAYESRGDFENALRAFEQFKAVNDALFDAETSGRIVELQTRNELEKKDREIALLTTNQQIQRVVRNAFLAGSVLLLVLIGLLYNRFRLKDRANTALRIAQTEREEAARAELVHVSRVATMGELAAALAHELNQPLTAILSNAQATRRMLPEVPGYRQEFGDALGDIVQGAKHASDIIQRLRELIRRGDIVRGPLNINETILQIEKFAQAVADEKNVKFKLELAEGLPRILGDRVQLQQVLLNLVHNAAEVSTATDDPKVVIETVVQDSQTILVRVRDTGPEVDEPTLARMFEPFFSTKEDGLGMGLPICSTIIEAHGGRLWATGNPDRGMTVQFTLQVAAA